MEKWAADIQKQRMDEAKRHNRWASARKAIREVSKNINTKR
jgi:hypothetical protein